MIDQSGRRSGIPTMWQLQLFGIGDIRLVESPVPTIGTDEILVKVAACGICPTDVRKYSVPNYNPLDFPFNPGHEWTGTVLEVGHHVSKFKVGDRIAAEGLGGYAEFAKINSHDLRYSVKLPDNLPFDRGTLTEPLADCIHAVVNRSGVRLGDSVVVLGSGVMGAMIAGVAALSGAEVLVSEPIEERRRIAASFGASRCIDPDAESLLEVVMDYTDGRLADVCIVTIANETLITQAVKLVGQRGRVLLFGGGAKGLRAEFDPNWVHYNEITVTGSEWIGVGHHADSRLYETAVTLLAKQALPFDSLLSHSIRLQDVENALKLLSEKNAMKVIVHPNGAANA